MKRKVLFIIVFTLIIVIWAILVCYSFNKHQQEKIIKEDETKIILRQRNIPYGVTLTYQEIIAMLTNNNELNKNAIISLVINGKDIEENENYKFQSIGENNITLNIYYPQFKLCKNRLKLSLKWLVIDDEAPIIEEFSDIQVVVGTEIDFNNYIIAKEASGERIPITIEGDYNLAIPGVYELNVKATNAGGISTEKKFRLIVGQKEEPTTTTSITTTKKTTTKSTTKKTTTKKTTTKANDASTKSGRLNLAKAEAKKVVKEIIKPQMTKYEKAEAIFNYLHSNVATQHNQSSEAYKVNHGDEAYAALIMKIAACSGFCKAVTLMCEEAGLNSKHINANQWTHQWNMVQIDDGSWIVLDAQGGIFGGSEHPFFPN